MRNIFMSLLLALGATNLAKADDVRLISVTGMAEKSYQPDMAVINVSVWGKGKSAKKAQEVGQKYYGTLTQSLSKFKVQKEDVKTIEFSLNPDYEYDQTTKKNNITSYQSNQTLTVTIRDVAEVGNFIDSLTDGKQVSDGGINLNGLSFDISTRKEEQNKLVTTAVANAQLQAEVLAKAAKVKLKGVYRLMPTEQTGMRPRPRMMNADMGMLKSASTEVMTGEVKIISEVSAEYIIE